MAYELKKDEDEVEGQASQDGAPILVTGGTGQALTSGGTASGSDNQIKEAPASGSNVADIGKYLDLNRQKAQALGEKVGGFISSDISKAQTGIQEAQDQFKGAVKAGTVGLDQNVFSKAKSTLTDPNAAQQMQSQLATYGGLVKEGGQASGTYGGLAGQPAGGYQAGSAQEFMDQYGDAFKQQYGAQYGGPTDIISQQYYQQAEKDRLKAERTARNVDTSEGRQELIARAMQPSSGRFSKGSLALDQALIAGEQDAFKKLQEAATPAQELQAKIQALQALATDEIARGRQESGDTRQAYRSEFDLGREEAEIEQAYGLARAQAESVAQAQKARAEQLGTQEGISSEAFYGDEGLAGFTKQQAATQGDIERLRALEALTGVSSQFTPYEKEAGQVDQYMDPSLYFKEQDYLGQVASAKDARIARENAAAAAARQARLKEQESNPAQAILAPIAKFFKKICFEENTPVTMADLSTKPIKDIRLGDELMVGGKVTSIAQHAFDESIFAYQAPEGTVHVTGFHAVFENDTWKRVKDSEQGLCLPRHEMPLNVVYTLNSEHHRILIKGQIFADFMEVDNDDLYNDEECLDILNKKLNLFTDIALKEALSEL